MVSQIASIPAEGYADQAGTGVHLARRQDIGLPCDIDRYQRNNHLYVHDPYKWLTT